MNPGGGTPGLWILQEDMFMFSFCYFHLPRSYFSLIIELGFHLITTIIYFIFINTFIILYLHHLYAFISVLVDFSERVRIFTETSG